MLPRSQRVRLTADIQQIYAQGVKVHHSLLRISALQTKQFPSRATVVVSKRVHLNATIRNKIKRRVRARLKPLLPKFKQSYDVVIVAQPKAVTADYAALSQALEQSLHKLGIL